MLSGSALFVQATWMLPGTFEEPTPLVSWEAFSLPPFLTQSHKVVREESRVGLMEPKSDLFILEVAVC